MTSEYLNGLVQRRRRWCAFLAGVLLTASAHAADIDSIDLFFNRAFVQTSNAGALLENGAFMTSTVLTSSAGVFSGGSLTGPGAQGPVPLSMPSPSTLAFQSTPFFNLAAMDTAFGPGAYTFSLVPAAPASPPTLVTANVGAALYANAPPALTGTSYSRLQGMDVALPVTLDFSPFVTQSGADDSFQFFTVYDYTLAQFVFQATFLPASNTGITLPASTLLPGRQYAFELNHDTRVYLPSASTNQDLQIGFDMRTMGTFTTAVPEPAAWWLMLSGLGMLVGRLRRP